MTNREMKLLWIGYGSQETQLVASTKQFTDMLARHQIRFTSSVIEGGHTWHVWRRNLRDLLPLLFR
jgi:enterochelin esterase family protein